MDNLVQSVSKHLEFYGYDVEFEEDILKATHTTNIDFWAWPQKGGLLIRAVVGLAPTAKDDLLGVYAFLNAANELSIVSRYLLDEEDFMAIEAWFPPYYERKPFAAFFEQFLEDVKSLPKELNEAIEKYVLP